MSNQPDDPKNPHRRRPPELNTEDREHVRRIATLMTERGLKADGRIRDDYKAFMKYAWASENDVPVFDCVLVEEQVSAVQKVYFFAEKLPRDARFAMRFSEMSQELTGNRHELSLAMNKIAALESEIANLRGEGEPV